jgi:hypothetical protein
MSVDHAKVGDRPANLGILYPMQRLTNLGHHWMFSG